ncbi:unnamed protein product [Blepharisma stoltei]|uniref:L-2-hydroxyglutarate dehydrogenase, mitochondrial n=1 Tax=Blepharisma stoltei TaxID=1481888 RepID=A0AAU9K6Y3_9CILI|nr:unnamed protein product [Blepharisma stoltei]
MNADFLIIGGGIIGLSMARVMSQSGKVVLIEKDFCGAHASGRNSAVVHAGIYYPNGSSKALHSVKGNALITEYCKSHGIKIQNIGKIIAPANDQEAEELKSLYDRGIKNGAPLKLIDYHEAKSIEPRIIPQQRYIWSPSTSIADNKGVIKALKQECEEKGVKIVEGCKFLSKADNLSTTIVETSKFPIEAKFVINCAGMYVDKIAKQFGFGLNYEILPIIGLYLDGNPGIKGFNTLIYPCPSPDLGLGVHTTNTVHGVYKLGPTATPALWREQYAWNHGFSLSEVLSSSNLYLRCLFSKNWKMYIKLFLREARKYQKSNIVADCNKLVSGVVREDYKHWGIPAMFPQLVDKRTYTFVDDFAVEGDEKSIHFLNIVSPGWTSSLSFTQEISKRILK